MLFFLVLVDDPSKLAFSERIKLFNEINSMASPNSSFGRRNARFQTQPVTLGEMVSVLLPNALLGVIS